MIAKADFHALLGVSDDNQYNNLYNKLKIAEVKGFPIYTKEFYPPNVWSVIKDYCRHNSLECYVEGSFPDSERRTINFNISNNLEEVIILKVSYNDKFNRLKHKDFLGALMGLGIKREKLGDIVLIDNECFFATFNDMEFYIIESLTKVGNVNVKVEKYDSDTSKLVPNFEEKVVLCSALRIDAVVASICNISRTNAVEFLSSGKVLINYSTIVQKNYEVKVNDRITVRGVGKFIINEIIGLSKSGRLKISIKKYI